MERRRSTWCAITVAGLVLVSACSESETGGSEPDPVTTPTDAAAPFGDELFTEGEEVTAVTAVDSVTPVTPVTPVTTVDSVTADDVTVDEEAQPVEPVTESLPPVAETGVPGIESNDAFCRSWSTYAGSVQALSLAWALQPPEDASALEVAATAAVTDAVEAMAAELPTEIESNRQALTVDVPGPFLRRADRARSLLVEAGLTDPQIEELGDMWVAAITEQGTENENLVIDVPPESADALDATSQSFADELPSVVEDPTLDTTAFDIGPSLDYISANCPDQGTLAGNDVVDI